MSKVDWERVAESLERERHRMIWRPYGLPSIVNPLRSEFVDAPIQTPWKIPEKMIVSSAITGAFFMPKDNPNQPVTPEKILEEARACAAGGASTVHIHVRDDQGYNTLSLERFNQVIVPLREEFPQLAIDGCLVAALPGEWEQMQAVLDARLLDAVPVNTTAVYMGDALFAKPIPMMLEKARLVQEAGAKVLIAVYTDGDISNADRFLIRSGLVDTPSYWCVLPALPGCSPMENPRQMIDGLMRMSAAIYDVDPNATILVCAAGRASMFLVTAASVLGLHIRVGLEDTVWLWPHREDAADSNLHCLQLAQSLSTAIGRDIASHDEYRAMVGMKPR